MAQIDLFDVLYEDFRFKEPIRTITSFSGIGFQEMGMDLAEIPHKVLSTIEIDKYAMLSYAAIHTDYLNLRSKYDFPNKETMVEYLQERNIGINIKTWKQTITMSTNEETVKDYYLAAILNNNMGDISKVKGENLEKDIDLLTYSFPCTDLSKAGQRAGLQGGTRSGLVYEVLRILHELKEEDNLPKVLIMENVVDLVQVNFIDEWNKIALEIEQLGYMNYTQVLNGKDYGIAQNRQRVFMVSILGEYNYNFPKPIELKYRLKDYLESEVDEKYYLSDKMIKKLNGGTITNNYILIPEATEKGYKEAYEGDGIYHNRPWQKRGVVQDGMIQTLKANNRDVGVVVRDEPVIMDSAYPGSREPRIYKDTAPTLTTKSGSLEVIEPNAKRQLTNAMLESGNFEPYDMVRHSYTASRMEDLERKEGENNIGSTLTTRPDTLGVVEPKENYLRIRKLTVTEVSRLMGMNDEQALKQQTVSSNAQAYKQCGNGIVAQVIGKIIGMMWYEDENELNEIVEKNSHTWIKEKENEV